MINTILDTLRANRFLRFLVAGAFNTLLGFSIYSAAILLEAPVWLALMIGLVSGVAFNFFSTGGYVFRDIALARLPRFVLCYLVVYGVNLRSLEWLCQWGMGTIAAQALLSAPVALLSYFLMARLVFVQAPGAAKDEVS